MAKPTASILHVEKRPYTTVDNSVLDDERLSADSLGVWVYLSSRPDGWRVIPTQIQKRFGFGREKWSRISRELRALGLIKTTYTREKGRITGSILNIGYKVEEPPKDGLADTTERRVSSHSENLASSKHVDIVIKESNNNKGKSSNKVYTPAVPASDDHVSFDDFWAMWPKRVAKSAAQKAWKKLKPDAGLFKEIYENLEKHAHAKDWEDAQYIPNPATYLNGRRWEDQVIIRSRPGARPEDHDKAQRMAKILEGIPL